MPCWYYNKKELRNTPSALDNIDYDTELQYRREGARFIIDSGSKMKLGCNTAATGVVYFHRFYMFHSFRQFPRYVTACCCLFLAGKVEETPKKCKTIIETAQDILGDKFSSFGEDPKEEVMTLERILLQTIKFDLQVEHPYNYLINYAKCLKGDKVKLKKMVQMAWTFVNDSLCTTLALQWEPEIIAVALMYLAGKLSQFEVVDWVGRNNKHLRWWDMFVKDVTMDLLEDICHQVLDLYSHPISETPRCSPPPLPQSVEIANPTITSETNQTPETIPKHLSPKPELPTPISEVPLYTFPSFSFETPHTTSYLQHYVNPSAEPPNATTNFSTITAPPPVLCESYIAQPPTYPTAPYFHSRSTNQLPRHYYPSTT